jgi:hypothetical protein
MVIGYLALIQFSVSEIFMSLLLGVKGIKFYSMIVHMSHFWFLFNNLSFPVANHLKFIQKVRNHNRKSKFDYCSYHVFHSGVMSLDFSGLF